MPGVRACTGGVCGLGDVAARHPGAALCTPGTRGLSPTGGFMGLRTSHQQVYGDGTGWRKVSLLSPWKT